MTTTITFLGIESSCDDTAAAVVRHSEDGARILSNVVLGQSDLHAQFGGVVPEIAARAHAEKLDLVVKDAMRLADLEFSNLDGIAVTAGPGLIGGVLAGVMCAKGLSAATGLPLIGVNHLAGHALTPRLTNGLPYPYLMLLISGGHCQFLSVLGPETYHRIGGTIDDAPGEAFDKTAKLLGLPSHSGQAVESAAAGGDPTRFALPRPLLDRPDADMSFSGLKTAVVRERDKLLSAQGGLYRKDQSDLCAAFQFAVRDVLAEKSRRALAVHEEKFGKPAGFCVAGGVAANACIRAELETVSEQAGIPFVAPPLALCTDNGAMIAWAGIEQFKHGKRSGLDLSARPRWPLDQSQPSMLGSGKKGAKA